MIKFMVISQAEAIQEEGSRREYFRYREISNKQSKRNDSG
jgi:hypothetical protein